MFLQCLFVHHGSTKFDIIRTNTLCSTILSTHFWNLILCSDIIIGRRALQVHLCWNWTDFQKCMDWIALILYTYLSHSRRKVTSRPLAVLNSYLAGHWLRVYVNRTGIYIHVTCRSPQLVIVTSTSRQFKVQSTVQSMVQIFTPTCLQLRWVAGCCEVFVSIHLAT